MGFDASGRPAARFRERMRLVEALWHYAIWLPTLARKPVPSDYQRKQNRKIGYTRDSKNYAARMGLFSLFFILLNNIFAENAQRSGHSRNFNLV